MNTIKQLIVKANFYDNIATTIQYYWNIKNDNKDVKQFTRITFIVYLRVTLFL